MGKWIKTAPLIDIDAQQQRMHQEGVFHFVKIGDLKGVMDCVTKDPNTLQNRDAVGAAPIHIAFLYKQFEIGKYLVEKYSESATCVYEGTESVKSPYAGENILHIAIIHGAIDIVAWLLEKIPKLVQAEAIGSFFSPGSQCYFGGTPLLFAVGSNQPAMVSAVAAICDPSTGLLSSDRYGNTALHIAVVNDLPEMYDFVLSQLSLMAKLQPDTLQSFTSRCNNENLTPLSLAACLGKTEMFQHILARSSRIAWTFGPVTSKMIPLSQLEQPDTIIATNGKRSRAATITAIEAICSGHKLLTNCMPVDANDEELYQLKLDLIMLPQVQQLLDKKWQYFGRGIFLRKLVLISALLVLFTIVTQMPNHFRSTDASFSDYPFSNTIIVLVESIIGVAVMAKVVTESRQLYRAPKRYWTQSHGSALFDNILGWVFSILFFCACLCRITGESVAEDAFTSIAAVIGWSYMFFFLLGFKSTGPFVIMVKEMMLNDIPRFAIVYMAVLIGFSQAFSLLLEPRNGFWAFFQQVKLLVLLACSGDMDYDYYSASSVPWLTQGLIFMYIVITVILLLNLLIAMMGNTYSQIYDASTKRWYVERANIMLAIEQETDLSEMSKYRLLYSAKLDQGLYFEITVRDERWNKPNNTQ